MSMCTHTHTHIIQEQWLIIIIRFRIIYLSFDILSFIECSPPWADFTKYNVLLHMLNDLYYI